VACRAFVQERQLSQTVVRCPTYDCSLCVGTIKVDRRLSDARRSNQRLTVGDDVSTHCYSVTDISVNSLISRLVDDSFITRGIASSICLCLSIAERSSREYIHTVLSTVVRRTFILDKPEKVSNYKSVCLLRFLIYNPHLLFSQDLPTGRFT